MNGKQLLSCAALVVVSGVSVLHGCDRDVVPIAADLMSGPYHKPDFGDIDIGYPEAKHIQTIATDGLDQHYMVQEPESIAPDASVLLYMHGADGDETQGMDPEYAKGTFARLRTLLAERGWIYVTARYADYRGIRYELEEKYGPRRIVLSGSSLGGKQSIWEAMTNPGSYAGVIAMCPALPLADAKPAGRLTMPVYIESGERDVLIAEVSRKIAATMKRSGRPFIYVEIPGGTHRTPIEQIDWVRALDFVEAHGL